MKAKDHVTTLDLFRWTRECLHWDTWTCTVLYVLIGMANRKRNFTCHPKQESLAAKCRMKERKLRECLDTLKGDGVIEITMHPVYRTNKYRIVPERLQDLYERNKVSQLPEEDDDNFSLVRLAVAYLFLGDERVCEASRDRDVVVGTVRHLVMMLGPEKTRLFLLHVYRDCRAEVEAMNAGPHRVRDFGMHVPRWVEELGYAAVGRSERRTSS